MALSPIETTAKSKGGDFTTTVVAQDDPMKQGSFYYDHMAHCIGDDD